MPSRYRERLYYFSSDDNKQKFVGNCKNYLCSDRHLKVSILQSSQAHIYTCNYMEVLFALWTISMKIRVNMCAWEHCIIHILTLLLCIKLLVQ